MDSRRFWVGFSVVVVAALAASLWMRHVRVPNNVAYVSEEEGGISGIDLNTLKVIGHVQPGNIAPRGLAVTSVPNPFQRLVAHVLKR